MFDDENLPEVSYFSYQDDIEVQVPTIPTRNFRSLFTSEARRSVYQSGIATSAGNVADPVISAPRVIASSTFYEPEPNEVIQNSTFMLMEPNEAIQNSTVMVMEANEVIQLTRKKRKRAPMMSNIFNKTMDTETIIMPSPPKKNLVPRILLATHALSQGYFNFH